MQKRQTAAGRHILAGTAIRALAVAVLASVAGVSALAAASPGEIEARFEVNVGQANPSVRFLSRGRGHTLFLTDREAWLVLRPRGGRAVETLRMRLPSARFEAPPAGAGLLPGATNYFLGRDPKRWRMGVNAYGGVRYADVYPGIDVVFHGRHGSLEYDFEIAPGSDPGTIAVAFEGPRNLGLDADGNLILETAAGRIVQKRPVAYQESGARRRPVSVAYAIDASSRVRFALGPYDPTRRLIIDPVLGYASYLGGALDDNGRAVAVDAAGSLYVAGQTDSLDFPVTAGAAQSANAGGTDVFVAKIGPAGGPLAFATYLGGSSADVGNGVALGPGGTVFVAGETASADFPVTPGAFQTASPGPRAGFVAKLDAAGGALVYSTYLGGSLTARCNAIAVDSSGQAYVVGRTDSPNFPTTAGVDFPAYLGAFDGFVTKLNAAGSGPVYSTYLGGGGNDALFGVALGPGDTACVAGGSDSPDYPTTPSAYQSVVQDTDPVVTKLDPNAASLLYSTFLGGASDMERANAFAVAPGGVVCVSGFTPSADFPVKNAAQSVKGAAVDAWIARFDPGASGDASLVYSTFFGGDGSDRGNGIAADAAGNAWVVGQADDPANFPVLDPVQPTFGGGPSDGFGARLSPSGALEFSTFLGGAADDFANAVTTRGSDAFVTGGTLSADFPTVAPLQAASAGATDAFFVRIRPSPALAPVPALSAAALGLLAAGLALLGIVLARRS